MILPHPRLVMAVEKKKGAEGEKDEKGGGGGGGGKPKAAVSMGLQIPPGLEDANIGFAQTTEKKDKSKDEGGKKELTLKEKETEKMDEFLKQIYKDTAFA